MKKVLKKERKTKTQKNEKNEQKAAAADKIDNSTGRSRPKNIGGRRDIQKIQAQSSVVQIK